MKRLALDRTGVDVAFSLHYRHARMYRQGVNAGGGI